MGSTLDKCFRQWWINSQRTGERARELNRLGLEYHLDLGHAISSDVVSGRIRPVYREVFGLDGYDYALEQDRELIAREAETTGRSRSAIRFDGLRRAVELYTAFPSDMHSPPESWARDLFEQARVTQRWYEDSSGAVYEHPWDEMERGRKARETRLEQYRRDWSERVARMNPPIIVGIDTARAGSDATFFRVTGSSPCTLKLEGSTNESFETRETPPPKPRRWWQFWK